MPPSGCIAFPRTCPPPLRKLEQEPGADFFIREKQCLCLSPMGHNFLCYATRFLARSEQPISITHAGKPAGNVAIGSIESTAATRQPSLLAAYHQRCSNVSLSLCTGISSKMTERVHALPPEIAETATWRLWRRDDYGPSGRALKALMIERTQTAHPAYSE